MLIFNLLFSGKRGHGTSLRPHGAPCSPARAHNRHIRRRLAPLPPRIFKPYARRQALFPVSIKIHLSVWYPQVFSGWWVLPLSLSLSGNTAQHTLLPPGPSHSVDLSAPGNPSLVSERASERHAEHPSAISPPAADNLKLEQDSRHRTARVAAGHRVWFARFWG